MLKGDIGKELFEPKENAKISLESFKNITNVRQWRKLVLLIIRIAFIERT